MSYCLNPSCVRPENPPQSNFCRNCGGRLRLRDRYLAVQPIGQGGFGRTFKAIDEDKPSKPFCVIKQFFPQIEGATAAQKAAELFTQEASALEQLDYQNIPKLLAYFITPDGRQYLVQEFIDGQNLKTELERQGKFSTAQISELLITILSTLDYIHQLGFIHRDIKPENIIRRTDNRKLYLVDFGAAKATNPDRSQMQGTTIGTPEFMAPEQGWGRAFPSSDLYSLGVTCLHLLTGVSPFNLFDDNRGEWIWKNSITDEIDPQLELVIDKLIQPKPIDRYPSAKDAIEALQGVSITNLPVLNLNSLQSSSSIPVTESVQNETQAISIQKSNPPAVEVTIPDVITTPIPTPKPSSSWQEDHISIWHNKPINAIDISTNGQYLISGDDGGTVAIWNLTMPQQPISTYSNHNVIYTVAISPNCLQVASGDKNRKVQLRRRESAINSLQELHADFSSVDSHQGFIYSVRFSPDGNILASGAADRRIRLWNTNTGKIISTLNGHQDSVMAMQFMPNGKILVSAGADRSIRFWDIEQRQLLKTVEAHDLPINALVISQDGRLIVSGSNDRTVRIRQLGTPDSHILQGHQESVLAVAISPDGKTIASGSIDGIVHLWDVDSQQLINSFQAHQSAVKSIVFQINGQFLITASLDRTIKIWRAIKT
jgi:serine/threonine protein kinase